MKLIDKLVKEFTSLESVMKSRVAGSKRVHHSELVKDMDQSAMIDYMMKNPKFAKAAAKAKKIKAKAAKAAARVAKKAMERKTGARGLRTILEQALLDVMYELPSQENVSKVVVDASAITGESKPYIVYEDADKKQVAASE